MVEVFKTNVKDQRHANRLLCLIHQTFREYKANFDLEDCDNILRVASATEFIQVACLIKLLQESGFYAEVLPDE
ncbi:hypothetical protein AHMF7605_07895 [Adhaeribacter arboris]|uniref:Uncharacterized protein n=1 Tax=Adhaeribacter arboris TaxID=2072846 RepID=A0A2T2YD55_9BACT|nr:hypothetical protein [Adhaeribacter arboris]PSR53452.1 hypothetical protein AHMF7605_07895 [Adhaeribacter arboris]